MRELVRRDLVRVDYAAKRFDSGLVNGGDEFPAINIAIAQNGFYCYDIVLDLATRPCRGPMLTAAPD